MNKITIKDIARIANVSPATVSRVINNTSEGVGQKTRERIKNIISEYGYQPNVVARSLATKKSSTIGLIIPDITNPFYPTLVKGVEEVATSRGYSVILCNSDNDYKKERQHLEYLKEQYVAGIVYNNFYQLNEKLQSIVNEIKTPIVYIDNYETKKNGPCFYVRHKDGMAMLTQYLIDMGHSEFAYISGQKGTYSSNERLEGFLSTLKQNNMAISDAFIKISDFTNEGGYQAIKELLDEKKQFSCVVCANDYMALGVLKLLHERGISVPSDLSIAGFDDISFSQLTTPALTTVNNPIYEMAKVSTHALIDKIESGNSFYEYRDVSFEPKLSIRGTVKYIAG